MRLTPRITTATVTKFADRSVKLTPMADSKRAFMLDFAVSPTNRSQLRCNRPSAPVLFTVSMPPIASTSSACFCEDLRKVWRTAVLSGICNINPIAITSGTATSGTMAIGPPT